MAKDWTSTSGFLQRILHHRMELALALVLALDMDPIETRMQQEFKFQFFPFESPSYIALQLIPFQLTRCRERS
jgi:cell division FtsZ-interacting protein ZapD